MKWQLLAASLVLGLALPGDFIGNRGTSFRGQTVRQACFHRRDSGQGERRVPPGKRVSLCFARACGFFHQRRAAIAAH